MKNPGVFLMINWKEFCNKFEKEKKSGSEEKKLNKPEFSIRKKGRVLKFVLKLREKLFLQNKKIASEVEEISKNKNSH